MNKPGLGALFFSLKWMVESNQPKEDILRMIGVIENRLTDSPQNQDTDRIAELLKGSIKGLKDSREGLDEKLVQNVDLDEPLVAAG